MLKIGEVSKRLGVSVDTLRFYEKQGLLTPTGRSAAGYRLYQAQDLARLQFIQKAKAVGFTLAETQTLLSIDLEKQQWACADVKGFVADKLQQVTEKISELQLFARSLQQLADACCGGPQSAEHCTILAALESQSQGPSGAIEVAQEHHHCANSADQVS